VTNTSTKSAGKLYVVATPIGNLTDLSARAGQVLRDVALVAAEDTRRCGQLLAHAGAETKMVSLHEHNETAQIGQLLERLGQGSDIALVSDAGTPLISDPGLKLVQAAIDAAIDVVAIPGPSAVTAALSVAGLATDRFVFEGFLPRRSEQRRARLEDLRSDPRTLVLFESVHRVGAALEDMARVLGGDRRAVIARELSKMHEQVARGTLAELVGRLGGDIPLLGEFVLVVAGAEAQVASDDAEVARVYALLAQELPPSRAVALCARITGRSRNAVYALTRA